MKTEKISSLMQFHINKNMGYELAKAKHRIRQQILKSQVTKLLRQAKKKNLSINEIQALAKNRHVEIFELLNECSLNDIAFATKGLLSKRSFTLK